MLLFVLHSLDPIRSASHSAFHVLDFKGISMEKEDEPLYIVHNMQNAYNILGLRCVEAYDLIILKKARIFDITPYDAKRWTSKLNPIQ